MGDLLEFMIVAAPLAAVIGTPIYLFRRKINGLQRDLAEQTGQNHTARIATEKSALEERVRVLERIVTSRGYTVAEEIEALRTEPAQTAGTGIRFNISSEDRA
jgi:hypothetical protein